VWANKTRLQPPARGRVAAAVPTSRLAPCGDWIGVRSPLSFASLAGAESKAPLSDGDHDAICSARHKFRGETRGSA
jgi:hypothetical protein